ncbi:MAG TPA: NAD-dependent epimerase/dehydratase family protein [Microlunatus sp.]|nr:NAD-dependent epimerase/dehydratase family protein [Microlunatus sp.]
MGRSGGRCAGGRAQLGGGDGDPLMKVLVIGATGYIGSVVTMHLRQQGHHVSALVRTPRSAPPGVPGHVADLGDPTSIRPELTAEVDAVVHAGAPPGDWDVEVASVRALLQGLCGRQRTFVYLSGTWVLGRSPVLDGERTVLDEFSPVDPIDLVAGRERVEALVADAVGCRGVVVRPGLVHGAGGGIPALMVSWARQQRRGWFVSAGEQVVWPMVHVDDLAALVTRVLATGRGGPVVHAIAEPAVDVTAVATAADVAAGGSGRAEPWPVAEAGHTLTPTFAAALATSQHVTGLEASSLGWRPTRPGVVEDLRRGSYLIGSTAEPLG